MANFRSRNAGLVFRKPLLDPMQFEPSTRRRAAWHSARAATHPAPATSPAAETWGASLFLLGSVSFAVKWGWPEGLQGAACMTELTPIRYQTWVCSPLLPPLPHHKQSSWIKLHFHFKLLMAFLVISLASFPVVLQVHMKSHFVSYYRIFSSFLRYSSAFRGAPCVTELLGFLMATDSSRSICTWCSEITQLLKSPQSHV